MPKRSSASSAGFHFYNMYQCCPRKMYLSFVCRLETKNAAPPLVFGTAFHEMIAAWYKGSKLTECQTIGLDILKSERNRLEVEDYDRSVYRLPILFKHWVDTFGERDLRNLKILGVEKEIRKKIPGTEFTITGRIDLIARDVYSEDYIYDHKTSSYSVTLTADALFYGDQVTTYMWLTEGWRKNLKPKGLIPDIAYWSRQAKNETNITCTRPDVIYRTSEEIQSFVKGLSQTVSEISQKVSAYTTGHDADTLFPRNTHYCLAYNRRCEFADICRRNITPRDKPPRGFRTRTGVKTVADITKGVDDGISIS